MSILYLVRGLPGSGKSTFAKQLNAEHVEADMYFMKNGNYIFDFTKLHQAHKWCQNKTEYLLRGGKNVVVSNTFTTERELKDYFDIAKNTNSEIIIYRMSSMYGSIHNVPEETMQKMKNRFVNINNEIIIN